MLQIGTLSLFQYDLYHWIGYFIGYFMTYGKSIVDKEQIHTEHLTATVAKQPLSHVVYPSGNLSKEQSA